MKWRYQLVESQFEDQKVFEVYEAYVEEGVKNPDIVGFSDIPIIQGDTVEEVVALVNQLRNDINRYKIITYDELLRQSGMKFEVEDFDNYEDYDTEYHEDLDTRALDEIFGGKNNGK